MGQTLVIIDGHYYAYRFFFGMPGLTAPDGRPTGVTFAFAKLLKDMVANPLVTHLAIAFDHADPTFRHDIFPDYKATRDPMPEALRAQIPDIDRVIAANRVPSFSISGYEADDVIATLARQGAAAGMEVRICSKDKDLDQVITDGIRTWDPGKQILRSGEELAAEKGIRPDQVVDYLCMIGDSSDNVPGIKGVGPKTAVKLLDRFGSLGAVLEHVDELKGKQREHVAAFKEKAALTRRLITLVDVPGLPALDELRCPETLDEEARALYKELGFRESTFFAPVAKGASDGADYRVLSEHELPAYLLKLRNAGRFAIDTETTGLDPIEADLVGISFACGEAGDKTAAYLPIRASDGERCCDWQRVRPLLAELLEDPSVGKIAQNAKYDLRVFARHGLRLAGLDGDPMLASWLLDPARDSHGLDQLTRSFLHEDKIPTGAVIDLAAGQTMAEVSVDTVARYACEDAQCTWRLAHLLEGMLADEGLLQVYREQEIPLACCLADMEQAGMPVDASILAEKQRHLELYLDQVLADIRAIAGDQFNPASPKQVGELLFEKLALPVIRKTKRGPSTDASVLQALRYRHEIVELLLQFRSLAKLLGTYVTTLPTTINPHTGRIHSSFKQTGTETGRLSSEHPNLQNIPKRSDLGREIRAAFVADAGTILLAADYSQIELRVLAHFAQDEALLDAFAKGVDIHRFVAAAVEGIDESAVTPEQRNAAKAVNFGLIYGQSAFGLAQQLAISRYEAQRFIDEYFDRFPGVQRFREQIVKTAEERGYVETLAGRRRYVPQLRSANGNERKMGERTALNSTIQGSAADLIKRAMLRCHDLLPASARLLVQIHDELIVEATEAEADAAATGLEEAMIGAWQLSVPLVADVRRGRDWLTVG